MKPGARCLNNNSTATDTEDKITVKVHLLFVYTQLSVCLSILLPTNLPTYVPVRPSINPPIGQSIYSSIHPSVHLSIYDISLYPVADTR